MAKQEIKYRANIGGSSLILIFIVMCLVTFGILSLTTAKNQWNLAERNAQAVKEYYRADGEGEAFYRLVEETAAFSRSSFSEEERQKAFFKEELKERYREEEDVAAEVIAMERGQALLVELRPAFGSRTETEVLKWKVIQTEDYEIDRFMPIWSGKADEGVKDGT